MTHHALGNRSDEIPVLSGLTSRDAVNRLRAGLNNRLPDDSSRSFWRILRVNVLTLFNGIVAGGFVLLVVLGDWQDALFGFAAVGNAVIGVVQEYRAKRLLDRLAILDASNARVLRDGSVREIPVGDVVQDDILVVRAGEQVSADAVVIDGDALEVDESLLTGESEPRSKVTGAEILSGSFVVGGQGRARVVRVGEASYSSRLTLEAKRFALFNSEIRNSLNRLLGWIAWSLLPVVVIVLNGQMQASGGWEHALNSGAWRSAVVGVVASVIAMVPLGLVLMSSVAFAVGAVRVARLHVLVQELPALEGLARVDLLCIDKTGTLTDGAMVFDSVHGTAPAAPAGWRQALGWFGADPNANATARCLAAEFPDGGGLRARSSVPFSSARKWSAVTFSEDSEAAGTWIMGAPELVVAPGTACADQTLQLASALAAAGLRTLVLAHSPEPPPASGRRSQKLPGGLVPVTLLTFRERVRIDAARTLAYFHEQGVAIRVLSGDDPDTAAAVAREVGLPVDRGTDARGLPADLDALGDEVANHLVFGRVTPYQKRDIVRALRRRGHVVAMTGDGVNDTLAMKEADIGIAMDSAAAATKAVSRLVLLDGRFERLPRVVAEGRRVIANFERLSILFLTKVVYIVILSVAYGLLLWEFPFLPRQLSATDGLTIGIPALFLALMPNTRRYLPGFLKRSLSFAVPAGAIVAGALLAVGGYARSGAGAREETTRTGLVIILCLVALWVLVVLSRPFNRWRLLIIGVMGSGLALLLAIPLVTDFFDLPWPPLRLLVVCLIASLVGCAGIEVLYRIRRIATGPALLPRSPESAPVSPGDGVGRDFRP